MASPSLAARAAILGVPYQPNKRPDPLGVVKAFEAMDAKAMAASAGAIVRDTLADMNAVTNPPAHQMGWVTGDATAANNGIYENAGSPSAPNWQRRADLPHGTIHMINVGAGTADAIVATASLPAPSDPGAALFSINIVADNTGPVTINGKPLRTNSGNEIAPGGLTAGSIHAFLDLGDHFRLLSDQASAAIVAAAEDAADIALAAASDAEAAKTAAESAAGANLANADSRAAAILTNIPGAVNYVRTAGYASAGDGGGALYKRVLSEPSHAGKFQSADGAWWEIAETVVKRASFGGGTPAQNTTALLAAMSGFDAVEVSPGVYDPIDLSESGVTLYMTKGAIFRLPDGVVHTGDVMTPHVVLVSGDDIKIEGDVVVDGNSGGQDLVTLPGGTRTGAYHVTGQRHRVNGTVEVSDVCWQGFATSATDLTGNDPATQVGGLFVNKIKVINPRHYAVLLWNLADWEIRSIEVERGTDSLDARIRTGVGTTSTTYTEKGKIGTIQTNDTVVLEARTNGLQIDSVQCCGLKTEDNSNIQVGLIDVDGSLMPDGAAAFSFAINNAEGIDITAIRIKGHKTTEVALVLSGTDVGAKNVSIGSIEVTGTVSNVFDMLVRTVQNVQIGSIKLINPVGTGGGFIWDYDVAYAPQDNMRIGSLISSGHTGVDITTENGGVLSIGHINPDATIAGVEATRAKYGGIDNTFTAALATGGGSVTLNSSFAALRYYRQGRLVFISGQIRVSAISSPTGALTLTGLPFTALTSTQRSADTVIEVAAQNMAALAGYYTGVITGGGNSIIIARRDSGNVFDAAAALTATSILTFSGCYVAA